MKTTVSLPELAPEAKGEETAKKLTSGLSAVADSQSQIAQQLSATESRLLTRGPSEGPMQSVAQASQKTAEAAEKTQQSSDRMVELLEQLLARNFIVAEAV
jgi:methyl-accepting chemotaxis protein